jgi:hypothetical protein
VDPGGGVPEMTAVSSPSASFARTWVYRRCSEDVERR